MHFLLWTKWSHQIPNFDTSKCSGKNLPNSPCHFRNHKWVFFLILNYCSMSRKISPLYFLGQTLYALKKRDQSKCTFFRLLSVHIKIHQILVIFKTRISFSSIFVSLFSIMRHLLCTIGPIKEQIRWNTC